MKLFSFNNSTKNNIIKNRRCSVVQDLDTDNLSKAVQCPDDVNINDWIAENVMNFIDIISLIYDTLQKECTDTSCPSMTVNNIPLWWKQSSPPSVLSAPSFVEQFHQWVESGIADKTLFPSEIPMKILPKGFTKFIRRTFKYIFFVFIHIYHQHIDTIKAQGEEPHLNTAFKHFMYFVFEHDLIKAKYLALMQDVICRLMGNGFNHHFTRNPFKKRYRIAVHRRQQQSQSHLNYNHHHHQHISPVKRKEQKILHQPRDSNGNLKKKTNRSKKTKMLNIFRNVMNREESQTDHIRSDENEKTSHEFIPQISENMINQYSNDGSSSSSIITQSSNIQETEKEFKLENNYNNNIYNNNNNNNSNRINDTMEQETTHFSFSHCQYQQNAYSDEYTERTHNSSFPLGSIGSPAISSTSSSPFLSNVNIEGNHQGNMMDYFQYNQSIGEGEGTDMDVD